jgi:hypothetical protein
LKLSVLALAALLSLGCREEFARWTKRSALFHSEKESWPDVLRELRRADALLLERGWKRDPQTRTVASLPTDPREAAARVGNDTSIDAFRYVKGNRTFELRPCGLWDGIPWWRRANHAEVFWRAMEVWTMDEGE